MSLKKQSPFVSGLAEFLTLSLLSRKKMYGYQIIKEINTPGRHPFRFGIGTIYPILYSLEKNGFVERRSQITAQGKECFYYKLTEEGTKHLKHLTEQWEAVKNRVDAIAYQGVKRASRPT